MTFKDWWATEQHEAAQHFPPHLLEYAEALAGLAWRYAETEMQAAEWAKQVRWVRELTEELCQPK